MLSFIARFGSSKGMVLVPNLSGLTTAQATSEIQNAGLIFSGSSTSTTSSPSLGDTVFSQSIASGTLVEYETAISFANYVYVAYVPTVTYGECTPDYTSTSSAPGDCIAGTFDRYRTTIQYRHRAVFFDGVFQRYDPCSSFVSGDYISNVAACGYVAPAKTCASGCGPYSAFGSCQILYGTGGQRSRTRTCTRSDCSTYTQVDTEVCCQSFCGPWSGWASSTGGVQERSRSCQRANCTTYTDSEVRCTVRTVTGSCGACTKKAPFRRTCSTTTINSDCSTTPGSVSQAC
jgi:PASTA domain